MKIDELNQDNWVLFAIKNYDNPQSVTYSDFEEDVKKFKYIKRLLRRYQTTGEFKKHLILNHIIVIFNVFGIEAALNILLFKMNTQQLEVIKPLLVFLRHITDTQMVEIKMDKTAIEALRKI